MKIFIDIETVPCVEVIDHAPESLVRAFLKRFDDPNKTARELWREKAGLFAEYGKIVCVSMGYVADGKITVKSFAGENEHTILFDVSNALDKATGLVAHNGKDFDYPFLCRRMIVNGIKLPAILQIQNLKPWEIKLEDTLEMWKFGQFNHRAGLAVLCELFGLPSPKAGMDGSQVQDVYYIEKSHTKIADYCEGDVRALINVYRKMQYVEPILQTLETV
jgi:3'-5' exonuclease